MKTLVFILIFFTLSACSLHSSQGRKQFESESAGKIRSFSLQTCQKQNPLAAWFYNEFPSKSYELVTSEPDLEIWKSTMPNGSVEIKATQINSYNQKITCTYLFANEDVWKTYQSQFVQELENNMMTSE